MDEQKNNAKKKQDISDELRMQIEDAIEFNQPIILLLKMSVSNKIRMSVVKMIMRSTLPTKIVNFKNSDGVDKEFISDMNELNRQLNEGVENQWIIVFKDREMMEGAFSEIGMEDIVEECAILEFAEKKKEDNADNTAEGNTDEE